MWIAAGTATDVLIFIFLDGIFFILAALPVTVGSVALAFIKIDGVPLVNIVAYMLSYAINPKKYTYQKEDEPVYKNYQPPEEQPPQT
jgi:hypothetical protein